MKQGFISVSKIWAKKSLLLGEKYESALNYRQAADIYRSLLITKKAADLPRAITLRAKINLGNVHFKLVEFPDAIKYYKMALDQVGQNDKETYGQIMHNIGLALVQQEKYREAAVAFEYIVRSCSPCAKSYVHLLLCLFILGKKTKTSRIFRGLVNSNTISRSDSKQIERLVFLLAPLLDKLYYNGDGFQWCLDTLRLSVNAWIADDLVVTRAVFLIRNGQCKEALAMVKHLIDNSKGLSEKTLVNLSFICLNLGKLHQAKEILQNCISARALNNLGVLHFQLGEFDEAKKLFNLSIQEGEIYEAHYNLAIAEEKCGYFNSALDNFTAISLTKIPCVDYKILQLNLNKQSLLKNLNLYLEFERSQQRNSILDPKINLEIGNIQQSILLHKEASIRYYDSHFVNPFCNILAEGFFQNCLDLGKLHLVMEFLERLWLSRSTVDLEVAVIQFRKHILNKNCWISMMRQFPKLKLKYSLLLNSFDINDDITTLLPLT